MSDLIALSLSRRSVCGAICSLFFSSCKRREARININISLFSYLDRPIFDVMMNGTNFMSALAHGFYGENSVMAMQPITLGVQMVSWRLGGSEGAPGNDNLVMAINKPLLRDIPNGVSWLGLHIYPDYSVEIKLSKGSSEELQTEKGGEIIRKWESKNRR